MADEERDEWVVRLESEFSKPPRLKVEPIDAYERWGEDAVGQRNEARDEFQDLIGF